jgi:hypothetical protein
MKLTNKEILVVLQALIKRGLYIMSREEILAEQDDWAPEDLCKNMDFAKHKLWLLSGGDSAPQGFDSIKEILTKLNVKITSIDDR